MRRKKSNRKPRKAIIKSNAFVFTLFVKSLEKCSISNELLEYIVVGLESCPTTDALHFQGYVYFKKQLSFREVRLLLPNAHIELAKESPRTNFLYCTKSKKYMEFGSIDNAENFWYNKVGSGEKECVASDPSACSPLSKGDDIAQEGVVRRTHLS